MTTLHFSLEGTSLSHLPDARFDIAPPLAEKGDQILCADGVLRTIASRRFVYGVGTDIYYVLTHP